MCTVPLVTATQLRTLRTALGLTQVQLAEQLGVTSTTVARWERGEVAIAEPAARLVRLLAGKPEPGDPRVPQRRSARRGDTVERRRH